MHTRNHLYNIISLLLFAPIITARTHKKTFSPPYPSPPPPYHDTPPIPPPNHRGKTRVQNYTIPILYPQAQRPPPTAKSACKICMQKLQCPADYEHSLTTILPHMPAGVSPTITLLLLHYYVVNLSPVATSTLYPAKPRTCKICSVKIGACGH